MTTAVFENTQLIPGYTTTDRLGSGGYGEVFRAEAPGGFQKAVKVVYGFHDDERAKRELKSLERIKSVRHPFLLTVERAEIVDGRLAILMELADESLDQRFDECQEQGLPGIPRDELLGFMHDAADALDFLLTRHQLQHLDIKPENMLLLAGHIKVADFGLVKEITDRSQFSMVGGMTPTYAAPELFDGRPSPHSDQYSLAIVYQEMLTGALPFPGRTSAQLAMQHTQGRPMLTSLPEHDREVVAKALAKKPTERFASCLEFVQTLRGERPLHSVPSPSSRDEAAQPLSEEAKLDDTKSLASGATECLSDESGGEVREKRRSSERIQRTEAIDESRSSSPAETPPVETEVRPAAEPVPEDPPVSVSSKIVDGEVPLNVPRAASFRPTLYIGLGGQGTRVLTLMRERLARRQDIDWTHVFPCLALDTDRTSLQTAESTVTGGAIKRSETLHLPLRRPQHYRSESTELLQWLSRRWLYNIPRTLQTRGFRPLGRLALVDHATRVIEAIEEGLALLSDRAALEEFTAASGIPCRTTAPRVVLVGSTNGGTGGGIGIDLAFAVRAAIERSKDALESDVNADDVDVIGLFTHATRRREEENALNVANAYSWLSELATINRSGNRGSRPAEGDLACFEGDRFPFSALYFVHLGDDLKDSECDDADADLADYLVCDAATPISGVLEACRGAGESPSEPQSDVLLRSFAMSRPPVPADDDEGSEHADAETAPESTPEELSVLPVGCGHTRRLIQIAAPADRQGNVTVLLNAPPLKSDPAAEATNAPVPMLCEVEGLSLAHVAEKLVESRPDAIEAAHRLHTRNDIEWRKLPRVVVDVNPVDENPPDDAPAERPVVRPAESPPDRNSANTIKSATLQSAALPLRKPDAPRRVSAAKTE